MNDRIRRTVIGVFHHVSPTHAQACFDEVGFRWSQRRLIGYVNRQTRKGRTVSRRLWERVQPSKQMAELLGRAPRRRLRRTATGSLEILSGRRLSLTPATDPAAAAQPAEAAPPPLLLDDEIPF